MLDIAYMTRCTVDSSNLAIFTHLLVDLLVDLIATRCHVTHVRSIMFSPCSDQQPVVRCQHGHRLTDAAIGSVVPVDVSACRSRTSSESSTARHTRVQFVAGTHSRREIKDVLQIDEVH